MCGCRALTTLLRAFLPPGPRAGADTDLAGMIGQLSFEDTPTRAPADTHAIDLPRSYQVPRLGLGSPSWDPLGHRGRQSCRPSTITAWCRHFCKSPDYESKGGQPPPPPRGGSQVEEQAGTTGGAVSRQNAECVSLVSGSLRVRLRAVQ